MARRLPPLKSLVAFEAAARHLSISRAAEELCVVPAAISHHIRRLEQWLGVPLFRHENRALRLTEEGIAYARSLTGLFDNLAEMTRAAAPSPSRHRLKVTSPPSFTTKWLLPRLYRYRERNPGIDLDLTVSGSLTDCVHESTDVAVHYDRNSYDDLYCVRLKEVELFPVCRPQPMLYGIEPPRSLVDLEQHTLLHDEMLRVKERMDWRYWLQSAGATNLDIADRGLRFNQSALAYQAAVDGHGIVLAKNVLVQTDLCLGVLTRPFEHSCRPGFSYSLVCRLSKKDEPPVVAFREWLEDEFARESDAVPPPRNAKPLQG